MNSMAPKKTKKAASPVKSKVSAVRVEAPKKITESNDATSQSSVINRLSQQFNLLSILIVALFLFQVYTFYTVKNLEKNGVVGAGAGQQKESPLSQDNLISYAKDLKLNSGDFKKCLE